MKTRESYDRLASTYADHVAGELRHKPFDRQLLGRFAEMVEGTVADVGCGPGHVTGFLAGLGIPVVGVDLSPGMVEEARRLQPHLGFHAADMRQLPVPDGGWGGIVAFYCLIHLAPEALREALREFHRALAPGGLVLVAFHVGDEVLHFDELWEVPIDLDFRLLPADQVEHALVEAGFTLLERHEREPYPEVEAQTRRAYLLARK